MDRPDRVNECAVQYARWIADRRLAGSAEDLRPYCCRHLIAQCGSKRAQIFVCCIVTDGELNEEWVMREGRLRQAPFASETAAQNDCGGNQE
jgi:hypothetical protein